MAKTMTMDKIQEALSDIEDTIKLEQTKDILGTMREFAADASAEERPGMMALIEILEANYRTK